MLLKNSLNSQSLNIDIDIDTDSHYDACLESNTEVEKTSGIIKP